MKNGIFVLIILFAATIPCSFAQSDSAFLNRAVDMLKSNSEKSPIEKVYLQFDKPYYAAGDDIWFKAYVIVGSKHELSGISGILNVELINSTGYLERTIKLPLVNGLTWGDFKLPDTIKRGYYSIRAYTRWMRNAGSEYFYHETLYIGNSISNPLLSDTKHNMAEQKKGAAVRDKSQSAKTNVQFFPESGNVLYGVNSIVAFKAIGEDGLGKEINGIVTDENNNEVTRFRSRHLGMGKFNLLPVSGNTYKALVTFSDGSEKAFKLPTPQVTGYVMHIDNTDPFYIEVIINAVQNTKGRISLLAQSGGEVCYAAESKSELSTLKTLIPKSKFPTGIAQFTMLSVTGEPLVEQLVFIRNPDQLNLTVKTLGTVFSTRGRMQINIDAKDAQGISVMGNFSVSVIDENRVPANGKIESTILSNFLLTSDLRGHIEEPNYYFTDITERTNEDLNLLMLTQGYRRFEWKQIFANYNKRATYLPESSLEIGGRLKTLGGGRPIPHGKVSLLSASHGFFMMDTTADDQGNFVFKNLQFKDSTKFVIQTKKNNDSKNLIIEIDSVKSPPIAIDEYSPDQKADADTMYSVYLNNSRKTYNEQIKYGIGNHIKALKEVEIKGKRPLQNSSNLNGPGNADQVLLMKDIHGGCATIASCLQGRLNFVNVSLDAYGVGTFLSRNGKMAIYVDGFLSSPELLNAIPPEVIESVEVLTNGLTAVYGLEANGGALLINTKKGGNYKIASSNIVAYMPQGYYKMREFYSPQYDAPEVNSKIADLRSTIYWNPNIVTNKDGNASIEYFNAGTKGNYRIVIEGIDDKGSLGRQVYNYKVE